MRKDLVPSKLANLYASIIDQKKFSTLGSIMWDEFTMIGEFEISGLDNFITAMQKLEKYKCTMHQVSNIHGAWKGERYTGETYCIASHIYSADEQNYKLDMGIIYHDVIEIRQEVAKFLNRKFFLKWQKTVKIDSHF